MAIESEEEPAEPLGARPLGLATLLLLLGATLLSVYLVLDPLLSFPLFGSDSGEYYRLTNLLITTGHLPVGVSYSGGYIGWGFGYPDFPGLFAYAGAVSGALGVSPFSALIYAVPVAAALSIVPMFLLFRRLVPHDGIAVLAAGLASVFMPRLFSLAHPAPLALGDLLAVGGLWMFLEGRTDRRWYAPLALLGSALIVTHHLSSYFFLLSALGGLVLLELAYPTRWSRRFPLRELAFLGMFASGMLLFWLEAAPDFASQVVGQGLPSGFVNYPFLPILAVVAGMFGLGALIWFRRQQGPWRLPWRVSYPSDWSCWRDLAILLGGMLLGLGILAVVPLPSTTQHVTPAELLWFLPFILTFGFVTGSRRLVTLGRIGPYALTWLAALGLSALVALASPAVGGFLPPARFAEYLVIPLGILAALGIAHVAVRMEAVAGRQGLAAVGLAAIVVVGANAVIAFPPPAAFVGFQEGLTSGDAALWMWADGALGPSTVIASDHRLSSMLFGFDGFYATWQSTPALFVGSNFTAAAMELNSSGAPHWPYIFAIDAVAVDSVMYQGVALDPSSPALPLSAAAQEWLHSSPFEPLYLNGLETVYWVDWSAPTGPIGDLNQAPVGS
ncbi:MAG: hypothetical protein L3K03_06985 [Thermoplasmata archaeon]|nr:hypothetical protein [Thermoplasmata archaeon]